MRRSNQFIPPFPDDIDRDEFGHWLAGFTDGEGCFSLIMREMRNGRTISPTPYFRIGLRADDTEILERIRSFLQVGTIGHYERRCNKTQIPNAKLHCAFIVSSIRDLHNVIVPTFDLYQLHAKKKRDYSIWRSAIEICYVVSRRRGYRRSPVNGLRLKWTDSELSEVGRLCKELKEIRGYETYGKPPKPSTKTARLSSDHQHELFN